MRIYFCQIWSLITFQKPSKYYSSMIVQFPVCIRAAHCRVAIPYSWLSANNGRQRVACFLYNKSIPQKKIFNPAKSFPAKSKNAWSVDMYYFYKLLLCLATSIATVGKSKVRPISTPTSGAPPTRHRVNGCGMNHTFHCDKYGEKKVESS